MSLVNRERQIRWKPKNFVISLDHSLFINVYAFNFQFDSYGYNPLVEKGKKCDLVKKLSQKSKVSLLFWNKEDSWEKCSWGSYIDYNKCVNNEIRPQQMSIGSSLSVLNCLQPREKYRPGLRPNSDFNPYIGIFSSVYMS